MLPDNGEEEPELYDLAYDFFKQMNFQIQENITLIGASGKKYKLTMIVNLPKEVEINEILVDVVDWNRAVGVDRLIRFERILSDLNNRKGMIISNRFSDSAKNFAKRIGLIIYNRNHLYLAK